MSENGAVGFIGLGAMGYGMARNLVEKGHDVLAYDLQSQPLQRLVQQGGREAENVAEIGRSCRQVMVMVVDGAQVESIICGAGGLVETMTDGVILINSTIALSELRRIESVVEKTNVTIIDCPVSGGITGADEGTLTMLCGGDVDVFEAQRPLLDAVSANVTHLGPLGAGMVGKLANNLILGVGRLAIAEAFSMAQKAGLSTEDLYKTMLTCTADSKQLRGLEGAIVRGEYPSRTFLGLKDLSAAVDSGAAVGQAMPMTGLARELYQLIDDKSDDLGGSDEVMRFLLEN
jgi:3-hydroxyisobutyrate dehydrogenase-like beta-hydroxyacid dehydrogenase